MKANPIENVSEAIKEHTKWVEDINRCLICDVTPSENMIVNEGHLNCNFGKWLEENRDELKEVDLKIFYEVYEEHEKLHTIAREILDIAFEHNFMNISKHKSVPENLYDELLKCSKDIKKTLRKFRTNLYEKNV